MSSRKRSGLVLAAFIAVCVGGGALAGVATASSVATWYQAIAKPSWTPPGWLFAPVWTVLYIAMGIAAWRVWRRAGWGRELVCFAIQFVLNVAWSFVFFGLREPVAGMIEISVMWIAIAVTLAWFWKIDRVAGWLLAPYLAWVTFASALNLAIARLN